MNKRTQTILFIELIWLIVIILVAVGVILPLKNNARVFPFYFDNFLFIAIFITYFRLMFFIKSSFLTLHVGFKLSILAIAVPLTFNLIDRFNNFQSYIDNHGTVPFFGYLSDAEQIPLEVYVKNEMTFFGAAAIAGSILLPLFLVYSIWLFRNRGRHV